MVFRVGVHRKFIDTKVKMIVLRQTMESYDGCNCVGSMGFGEQF